jgi:uncharacterized protein (TIGR01319 family)
MSDVLCVDVGSTFTKAVLADADSGELLATATHPTTRPDVLVGIAEVREQTEAQTGRPVDDILVCSSAGGGLRLAVVGYERQASAEAGQRVALSAGGRVVHLSSGPLDSAGIAALRAARPDLIVLTGGTDGGNADVVVHNARAIAIARLAPVVLAANVDAAHAASAELLGRGRRVTVTANVLPQIGVLDPLPARRAIREAFLAHVIGGKGLSRATARLAGRTFAQLVKAATPDAVLDGVALLGSPQADSARQSVPAGTAEPAELGEDVLLVDVGGATTDVYSVRSPERGTGEGQPARQVVEPLWRARTVEGDLGVRAGARGLVEAAAAEGLLIGEQADRLSGYADRVGRFTAYPSQADRVKEHFSVDLDAELAALAILIAVRRHGRPDRPGAAPRPLREIHRVIGSGGVLRHADPGARATILRPLLADHGGGWTVPDRAALSVDVHATLFAAGLLAASAPAAAAALARSGLVSLDEADSPEREKMAR